MTSNFLATPQPLILSKTTGTDSFFHRVEESDQDILHGAVVTTPNAPGSIAYVGACNSRANGLPSQRILLTLQSPKVPVMSGTLEFTARKNDGDSEIFGALAGLAMNVIPKLLGANVDSAEYQETNSRLIPIMVGPTSVVQQDSTDIGGTIEPESILGVLGGIASTVIPVLAPVALDVAQQLIKKIKSAERFSADEEMMLDLGGIVGDIVKVAAPVAGAALTELGKSI